MPKKQKNHLYTYAYRTQTIVRYIYIVSITENKAAVPNLRVKTRYF